MLQLRLLVILFIGITFTSESIRSTTQTKKILHFSDSHLNISDPDSVVYGRDSSLLLLKSALQYAKQVVAKPDLFLFSGDHVAHGGFRQSYVAKSLAANVRMMHSEFFNHSHHQVFTASIGNADCTPDYHMEVTDPQKVSKNPSIQPISSPFKSELNSSERFALFQQTGFSIQKIDKMLHLISLNTIPYSNHHSPDTTRNSDPFNQFKWLDAQLTKISQMKEFAYIVGHIPPIINPYDEQGQWHDQYVLKYKKIIEKYTPVIRAQLFGHIHSIQFRLPVPHSKLSSLDTPLFTTGSISPLFGNNPSFTIWEYDPKSYKLLDYSVYFADLKSQPSYSDIAKHGLVWKKLLVATKAYSIKSLSTGNFFQLFNRMKKDDKLFNDYFNHTNANSDKFKTCTDAHCISKNICGQVWYSTRAEYLQCKSNMELETSAIKKSKVIMSIQQVGVAFGFSIAISLFVYLCVHCLSTYIFKVRRTQKYSSLSNSKTTSAPPVSSHPTDLV